MPNIAFCRALAGLEYEKYLITMPIAKVSSWLPAKLNECPWKEICDKFKEWCAFHCRSGLPAVPSPANVIHGWEAPPMIPRVGFFVVLKTFKYYFFCRLSFVQCLVASTPQHYSELSARGRRAARAPIFQ